MSAGDETAAIYRDAELGGRVGFGQRPVVLVVDFQRAFVDPTVPGGGDFSEAIAATRRLLDTARRLRVPVLFTVVAYGDVCEAGRFIEKCPALRYAMAGTPSVDIDERLARRDVEPILVKAYASAFFGTTLSSLLSVLGRDTVIVCGCTTSGCVRATVVDALQFGLRAIVPRECVADIAAGPHEANLFDMDAKYADVMSLDETLTALEESALTATGET